MAGTVKTTKPTSNNNKNSLYNRYSRYVAGGSTEHANDMLEWWERANFQRDDSDIVYAVENFYAQRLDLIASVFYNEPRYWWFLAQYNSILDPFTEITPGRILLIPTADRLSLLLGSAKGGVASTREAVTVISPIIT